MDRYATITVNRAGEGPTLYEGDDLRLAVEAARAVETGYVFVVDNDKVDVDNPGYVDWEDA